jgi:serine/threonine-protein kinase RsbW
MSAMKTTNVEIRLPSRTDFEKVGVSTFASVARLVRFREDRIEDLKAAVAEAFIHPSGQVTRVNRLNENISVRVVRPAGEDSPEMPA